MNTFNNTTQDLSDDITDISGGILFASLYNTPVLKNQISITDQIINDLDNNIIDINLLPKRIDYNTFRQVFYPTNNKHFQLSNTNESLLNLNNWYVYTSDGAYEFILHDFIFSAIEEFLGVSRNNFNPAFKIFLEKELLKTDNIRDFNKNGTTYALTWDEISVLLEQLGILYNDNGDDKVLLTLILNWKSKKIDNLNVRIYMPFVVSDIYKGWEQGSRLLNS